MLRRASVLSPRQKAAHRIRFVGGFCFACTIRKAGLSNYCILFTVGGISPDSPKNCEKHVFLRIDNSAGVGLF